METFEAIQKRRSIRRFKNQPVEWEYVGRMLESGRLAPSAGNLQTWRFLVVRDKQKKDALAHTCAEQYWIAQAPVVIIVCSEPRKQERQFGVRGKDLFTSQSAAAAVENMLLCATAHGLGACWIGQFDEEALKLIFHIPSTIKVEAIIPVGYADEVPFEPVKYDLADLVYLDEWHNQTKYPHLVLGEYGAITHDTIEKGKELVKSSGTQLMTKGKEQLKKIHQTIRKNLSRNKSASAPIQHSPISPKQ